MEITRKGINGFTLKMIAIVTMFIDHFAATIVKAMAENAGNNVLMFDFGNSWSVVYTIMRTIGRLAFPIYCFLLVEGFEHTRSRKKYAINLLVFAIVSELPFNIAFTGNILDFSKNNVFWTLFLGLVGMLIYEKIENSDINKILKSLGYMAVALAFGAIAYYTNTDYSALGIFIVLIMYEYRKKPILSFSLSAIVLGLYNFMEFAAFLVLPFIALYNGKRGYSSKGMKYFFYAFYPVHLLILGVIATYFL